MCTCIFFDLFYPGLIDIKVSILYRSHGQPALHSWYIFLIRECMGDSMLMATPMVKAGTDPLLCTTCHSVERSCPYKKETHKLPVAVQPVKRI